MSAEPGAVGPRGLGPNVPSAHRVDVARLLVVPRLLDAGDHAIADVANAQPPAAAPAVARRSRLRRLRPHPDGAAGAGLARQLRRRDLGRYRRDADRGAAGRLCHLAVARIPARRCRLPLLVSLVLPATLIVIPIFQIDSQFGLLNNPFAVGLAVASTTAPFSVWTTKTYFDTIPRQLEEAALVDGASPLEAFIFVVLPLSGPGIGAVLAFTSIWAWADFLLFLDLLPTTRRGRYRSALSRSSARTPPTGRGSWRRASSLRSRSSSSSSPSSGSWLRG